MHIKTLDKESKKPKRIVNDKDEDDKRVFSDGSEGTISEESDDENKINNSGYNY